MWLNDIVGQDCPVDAVFVLDGSDSVDDVEWPLMISFLNQLVARLDIDNGNTRVGALSYSSAIDSFFNLNQYTTVVGVQSGISGLLHEKDGTDTEKALIFVRTDMLIAPAGDRDDVPNVVVVMTDGKSKNTTVTMVCMMRKTSLFQKLHRVRKKRSQ